MACLGLEDIPYSLVGAHHHRICDEALLISLEKEGEEGNEEGEKNRMGMWKNKEGAKKKRSGEGNIKESLPILYKLGSRQIHCSTHAHKKDTS